MAKLDLKKALFILPNLFTLSSVFCGFLAILWSTGAIADAHSTPEEAFWKSAVALIFAGFFDLVDGRVARLTKTQSQLGVQLDSFADAISFGVAPALLMYRWGLSGLGMLGVFISFLFLSAGIIRLARFNVMASKDGGSSKFSLGIPIPVAALCLVSLIVAQHGAPSQVAASPLVHAPVIASLVVLLSFLMVSTIHYPTFKDVAHNRNTAMLFVGSAAFAFAASWVLVGPRAGWIFLACGSYTYILIGLVGMVLRFGRNQRDAWRDRRSGDRFPSQK